MAREPKKTPAPVPASTLAAASAPFTEGVPVADLKPADAAQDEAISKAVSQAITDGALAGAGTIMTALAQEVIPVAPSIDALLELAENAPSDIVASIGFRVVGPRQGRWRAGRNFGLEAQVLPLINLGEDELRAIDGDALLTWSVVGLPEVDEAEDAE
jgi:hypothetical protein